MNKQDTFWTKFLLTCLGLLIASIIILLLEFITSKLPTTPPRLPAYSRGSTHTNKQGIYCGIPGKHWTTRQRPDGSLLYNIEYVIDEYGRRTTPIAHSNNRKNYIAFFGGSFTFGEGVKNAETLPAVIGTQTKEYTPYNYGFFGFGPFDILALMEDKHFSLEIKEDHGIVIYVLIEPHVYRIYSPMSIISWHYKHQYYALKKGDALIRKGRVSEAMPFRTWILKILSKSNILRKFKVDLPPRPRQKDFRKLYLSIKKMQLLANAKFKKSTFYVLFYPGAGSLAEKIIPFLESNNINYLNYTNIFNDYPDKNELVLDASDKHPSAIAYKLIANSLIKDLHLK